MSSLRLYSLLVVTGSVFACSSGGSGTTPSTSSSEVCAKIAALPCSEYSANEAACRSALDAARQDAQQAGCASEYEAAVQCTVAHPPTCDATGSVVASPECTQAAITFAKCDPSAVCTSQSSTGSCSYSCSDSAMSCEQQGAEWTCTCTEGPFANKSFASTDSDPCGSLVLKANCE